ncbi:sigma-70 family RNA polymerase sigma factor [Streptomyces sp. NL15-2K]|uniref:sigma-70 family RNA polymerase sigma factor n=1 Tax=Streptomyces sp. NL15-2K TaxID=376149 RepID=UPI000F56983E|nr:MULTISPECIES: sigma-70 family RNA polymerase sigma factor [Actinomycetes]WKX06595.1 sigma-70 family RNA polymerase sigma factor [Kutzneria buriramensis]GCB43611.1 RNA polymerase sigma-70 factor [Streptomyces sp. NL15-2K]
MRTPTTSSRAAGSSHRRGANAPTADGFVRELYERHHGPLLRYVSGLLRGDRQRAEDFVQETLLRAWLSSADQPPGWSASRAWLFRVAHNLVVDWTRREQTRPEFHQELLETHAEAVDPISQAVHRCFLVNALSRLSQPHREILFYVYVLGWTGPDAADALSIPPGTVKSRTHHALRELRRRHLRHMLVAA